MYSWRNIGSPEYEEILTITRSLHLSQVMDSYFKQRLISHKIVSKTVDLNLKVLWFAPTRPMNENNMYGNVSFTLDWKTALEQFGPNLYFIDQQHNRKFHYGRVLLTNKNYEFLTSVDDGRHGMPVELFNNKLYAAPASEGLQYVLEIAVAVDCHGENWLYRNCKIEPNDHSSANTRLYDGGPYNPCICHMFNHFNKECRSPFNLQHTKMVLDEGFSPMVCNEPARQSAHSRVNKKKQKTKKQDDPSPEKRIEEVLIRGQKMVAGASRWSTDQKMVVGALVAALCWSLNMGQKLVVGALVFALYWPLGDDQKIGVGTLVPVLWWFLCTGHKMVAVALVFGCCWPLSDDQKMVVGTLVAVLCWSLSMGQKMVAGALGAALYWPLSDDQKMVVGTLVAALYWFLSDGQIMVVRVLVTGSVWSYLAFWRR